MRIAIELTGTTPLLMHNIRLADPDDDFTTEIAKITGKRKKTKDDRDEIARLEWYGGLYQDGGQVVMPVANVRRCFARIGAVRRLTTAVNRGLILESISVPLAYDGPADIDQLWQRPEFRHRTSVGVSGKRVTRIRPQFPTWGVQVAGELLTTVIDLDAFTELAELAGRAEGLGDNRINGYGRFTTLVKTL